VRTDERTWEEILKKVLQGDSHEGMTLEKKSLQELVKSRNNVFVLEEKGINVSEVNFGKNPVFILGDQVGLPRKDEKFALRYGKKISLGKTPYLAATCVDIVNYLADLQNVL
jgi:tRNA pseudouridine-54 N-methylase